MKEEVTGFLAVIFIGCALFLLGYSLPRVQDIDKYRAVQSKNNSQDEAIKELQKEIRLLKTDIYLIQNGYEEDYE